jgi:hypothetical protein
VRHVAYLTDRVRLANGEPQIYGTQVHRTSHISTNQADPRSAAVRVDLGALMAGQSIERHRSFVEGISLPNEEMYGRFGTLE